MRFAISLIAALATLCPTAAFGQTAPEPSGIVVELELGQQFYYEDDSLNARISVRNAGPDTVKNPIKAPLFSAFQATGADGKPIEAKGQASAEEPARPEKLSPTAFYGAVVDLTEIFPDLKQAGSYDIYWSSDGLISGLLSVKVLPRFDPRKRYRATLQTTQGAIVIDLFGDRSPIAVKSFIDLAHAGFYDGLQVHEVHADSYLVGGDPRSVEPPRPAIRFPAEHSSLPLVAGTVALKPIGAAPPANGPEFIIFVKPQPSWTGQVTILGQVTTGMDVVQFISRVPSSMQNSRPYHKPLREIRILSVAIEERPSEPGAGPSTEPEEPPQPGAS